MKTILASLLTASILPAISAEEKAVDNAPAATEFIKVERDEKSVQLQTSVTTYHKDGITVDLIGAIHVADAGYYDQLNKEFKNYQALLFEMIGGADIKNIQADEGPKNAKDPTMAMLGNIHKMAGKLLKLEGQKQGIDYTAKNFVHADLSLEEFNKLQQESGESLLGFAMDSAQNAQKNEAGGIKQPDLQKILTAVLTGNSNAIKLQLVDTMAQADEQFAAMKGHNVIINSRNKECLKVLNSQIKAGNKKLGIFYGAGHFPDMEKRMLKMGYKKTAQRWLTAWHIPKEAAQEPQKPDQKEPLDIPDAA